MTVDQASPVRRWLCLLAIHRWQREDLESGGRWWQCLHCGSSQYDELEDWRAKPLHPF